MMQRAQAGHNHWHEFIVKADRFGSTAADMCSLFKSFGPPKPLLLIVR